MTKQKKLDKILDGVYVKKDYAYYYGCFIGILKMEKLFTKEELVKEMQRLQKEKEANLGKDL